MSNLPRSRNSQITSFGLPDNYRPRMIRVHPSGASSPIEIPKLTNTTETPSMLMYGDKPIRVLTFEDGGAPYFSLQDICEAMGWSIPAATAKVDSILFPEHGKRIAEEESDEGVSAVTVLTPVGVYYLTDLMGAGMGQRIAAWAKREARRLCPEASPDDPTMFLTLSPGNRMPPRPMKWSGWRSEWYELRDAALGRCRGAHNPLVERQEMALDRIYAERMAMLGAQRVEREAA